MNERTNIETKSKHSNEQTNKLNDYENVKVL